MIRLGLPDGRRVEIEHEHLWSLTTRLVAEDRSVAHAVSTAADLRLALKAVGQDGEIALSEQQARAVLAVTGKALASDDARGRRGYSSDLPPEADEEDLEAAELPAVVVLCRDCAAREFPEGSA